MEYFLIGDEVFFGFYRTDGVNLTKAQCKRLEKRIPDFFRGDGDIQTERVLKCCKDHFE